METHHGHHDPDEVKDPVCGMKVAPATTEFRFEHHKSTFYFCSPRCLESFKKSPSKFIEPPKNSEAKPKAGVLYTCPMHPEVVKEGPGECPKCGMALEPVAVTAEEQTNPELIDMSRRFWVSAVLAVPLLILAMAEHIPGIQLENFVSPKSSIWWQFIIATPITLWGGWPFFQRGWKSIITRQLNMFTLIALGTGAAYAYSVVAMLIPDVFPDSFRGASGSLNVYFEAAVIIIALINFGSALEMKARGKTSEAIKRLIGLQAKLALVVRDGKEKEIPISDVGLDETIRVRPGECIPVDGVIITGQSNIHCDIS